MVHKDLRIKDREESKNIRIIKNHFLLETPPNDVEWKLEELSFYYLF